MTTSATPRFQDVHVQLTGQDGNVFAIIGRVRRALVKAGATQRELYDFTIEVMNTSSYGEVLAVVMRWVHVS